MASRDSLEHDTEPLYVVVLHYNPGQYKRRDQLTAEFIERLKKEPRVVPVIVECTVGRRRHKHVADFSNPLHLFVHVKTLCWVKESLFNVAVQHLTRFVPDWKYVAQPDADLTFLNPHWVRDAIDALQVHPVVQMFETSLDMGPSGRAGKVCTSFAARLLRGHKEDVLSAKDSCTGHAERLVKMKKAQSYGDSHPGYAWAYTREWLVGTGGLFDVAVLGSADFIMSCAIVGAVDQALSADLQPAYMECARAWQERVAKFGGRLGCVRGTIAHHHHGPKVNRLYAKRVSILIHHKYDPRRDVVKNECGVVELAGNKPLLEAAIQAYFSLRSEDDITE